MSIFIIQRFWKYLPRFLKHLKIAGFKEQKNEKNHKHARRQL